MYRNATVGSCCMCHTLQECHLEEEQLSLNSLPGIMFCLAEVSLFCFDGIQKQSNPPLPYLIFYCQWYRSTKIFRSRENGLNLNWYISDEISNLFSYSVTVSLLQMCQSVITFHGRKQISLLNIDQ